MKDYTDNKNDKRGFVMYYDILAEDTEERKVSIHYADSSYDEIIDYSPELIKELDDEMRSQLNNYGNKAYEELKIYIPIYVSVIILSIMWIGANIYVCFNPSIINLIFFIIMTSLEPLVILGNVGFTYSLIQTLKLILDIKKNKLFIENEDMFKKGLNDTISLDFCSKHTQKLLEVKKPNMNDIDNFKYSEVKHIISSVKHEYPELYKPKKRERTR